MVLRSWTHELSKDPERNFINPYEYPNTPSRLETPKPY